ncbi:MAG: BON domain-containing protein, partial [Gemmatimonadetes bacterium]|nr:BON domain-containing protein [Gemmatimonadota bacterium]
MERNPVGSDLRGTLLAALVGVVAGFAAGVAIARVLARREAERMQESQDPEAVAGAVLAALGSDGALADRAIRVVALAPGIVELAGTVASRAEAVRAAQLAREVPGVRTILNRLVAPEELVPADEFRARVGYREHAPYGERGDGGERG